MSVPIEKWKWFGMPGHLCVANRCRFHLHTKIGPYKISTVGAFYPNENSKRMQEIGWDRDYETYVFDGDDLSEIDGDGISLDKDAKGNPYLADELAEKMHMKYCIKYSKEK